MDIVSSGSEDVKVEVATLLGQLVYTWENNIEGNVLHTVDMSQQAPGQYVMTMTSKDEKISKMFILSK